MARAFARERHAQAEGEVCGGARRAERGDGVLGGAPGGKLARAGLAAGGPDAVA